jgi:nitrogen fixation protein FixH
MNGLSRAPSAKVIHPRSLWPLMIFALIGINVCIVGVTVYFAVSDKSAAIEPNYYAKALKYDETIQLRESSAALGWNAKVTLQPGRTTDDGKITLHLTDRDGHPIQGASATATIFASARASERLQLILQPDASSPGDYASSAHINRTGSWHIRLMVERGADRFFHEFDEYITEAR